MAKFHRHAALALLTLLLTGGTAYAADTFYKWEDSDGTTHYGTRPPEGVNASAIKPQTGHSEPVDYSHMTPEEKAQESTETASTEEEQEEESSKNSERCKAARKNKEILQRGGRVREPTEDGSFRYLGEEEKSERLERAQKAIDEAC